MIVNGKEYQKTNLNIAIAGGKTSVKALVINQNLLVGLNPNGSKFWVYNKYGFRVTEVLEFDRVEEAVMVGEFIVKYYGDFLHVWDSFPNGDIFSLCQWTFRTGINLNKIIKEMKTNEIKYFISDAIPYFMRDNSIIQ